MKIKTEVIGGLQLLLAAFIYGMYGLFYRSISAFGEFSQGSLRSGFLLLFTGIALLLSREKWQKYKKKDIKWFVLWIVPSSLQPAMTFLAFNNLPVGLVFYLLYASVIVSSFISGYVYFKEKLNFEKIVSLVFVLIGITFIYGSNLELVGSIYVVFALASGFLIGFWNTLTKKLSGNYSEEQMIFSDNILVFVVYMFVAFFSGEKLPSFTNYAPWFWLFTFSVITLTSAFLIVKGFKKVEAQIGSLIVPMEIVFGSIIAYIFLDETLNISSYIGGVLIFAASVFPYIYKIFKENKL